MIARLLRRLEAWLLAVPLDAIAPHEPITFDTVDDQEFTSWWILQHGGIATGFVDEISHPNADDLLNDRT